MELAGPQEYSARDVARAYAGALGRAVDAARVPVEGLAAALAPAGYSDDAVGFYREMVAAFEGGTLRIEGPASDVARGETTLAQFVAHALADEARRAGPPGRQGTV